MTTHPYYPIDAKLEGYAPMQFDMTQVLGVFGAGCLIVGLGTWLLSGLIKKNISRKDRMLATWFMVTGSIHFIIEGYVVAFGDYYKDSEGNYLSDAWKEYTKADSRYATRDSFIISMEAITAFIWGPLCPIVVYGILASKPWRYTLMVIISLGQIYGDVLYYGTCYLEGFVHARPEPLYFWGYFVALNALWILIPGMVLVHAANRISSAVTKSGKVKRR